MVFAKKTQQAFMTDDRKAAKLAEKILPAGNVQSTPHLVGWMYFIGRFQDSDKATIVAELAEVGRNLQPHLDTAYQESLRCRLTAQTPDLLRRASGACSTPQRVQKGISSSVIGENPGSGSGITKAPSTESS